MDTHHQPLTPPLSPFVGSNPDLSGFELLSDILFTLSWGIWISIWIQLISPQYLQNAQSGGLGCLSFTFKPTSCLSLQPVSVRGLYRLLWLDSRSTTLAGKLILWHSDALNARTESSLAACISQQSLQTHTACRSSYGSGSAAWSPV